jgi:hypothetical protein
VDHFSGSGHPVPLKVQSVEAHLVVVRDRPVHDREPVSGKGLYLSAGVNGPAVGASVRVPWAAEKSPCAPGTVPRPLPAPLPDKVWINEPPATIKISNSPQTTQAA